MDVAATRIVDAAGSADAFGFDQQRLLFEQEFNRGFGRVGQLETVRAEQLDAIVLERIVAGGNHDAKIGAHLAGQQGNGGSGEGAGHDHVHSHTGKAGDQRAFHHVARQPGVLADHDTVPVPAPQEVRACRLADTHRGRGGHHTFVRPPADAIGTEKLACH